MEKEAILHTHNLRYAYPGQTLMTFPDMRCDRGGHLLITGNSGTGKTTLLHLISGLLLAQQGKVMVEGKDLGSMSQSALDKFRGKHIGLIFQMPQFVSALTVVDNLRAAQFFGLGRSDQKAAMTLLEEFGIAAYADKMTNALSGGERQRLAIACALASKPSIVMADEPTSSLDDHNTEMVYQLLHRECHMHGAALVVVSHDQRLKDKFHERVLL